LRWQYRKVASILFRRLAVRRYLNSHQIRKLQIGAGPNFLEGWLNSDAYPSSCDVIYLNAAKPFPFKDGTFNYVFSEHLIEHLVYDKGLFMLRESYRVLKPGGRIRVATPDLERLMGLYGPEKNDLQQRYKKWIVDLCFPEKNMYTECFAANTLFRIFQVFHHKFVYDHGTLRGAMEEAGFIDIIDYKPGESDDEVLRGIESHGKGIGLEHINEYETMVVEAKRPS